MRVKRPLFYTYILTFVGLPIFTTFSYGCNLGPNQMARHSQGAVTSHMISYTNRRHISAIKIEAAIRDIINTYNRW